MKAQICQSDHKDISSVNCDIVDNPFIDYLRLQKQQWRTHFALFWRKNTLQERFQQQRKLNTLHLR